MLVRISSSGSRRVRRLLFVGLLAVLAVALAAAAASALAGQSWLARVGDGFGVFYESDDQQQVSGSFPASLSCEIRAGGEALCTPAAGPSASGYRYELAAEVTPRTGGGLGAGGVDAGGRALRPPEGVPPGLTCTRNEGAHYACTPLEPGAKLPIGTPIYELGLSGWVPGG